MDTTPLPTDPSVGASGKVRGLDPNRSAQTAPVRKRWWTVYGREWGFIISIVIGWGVELLYTLSSHKDGWDGIRAFTVVWFASGAAFFGGTTVGVLFGLPRFQARTTTPNSNPRDADTRDASGTQLSDNTNLQDVSDWLTKIIIGFGIAQFGEIIQLLGRVTNKVATGMGDADQVSGNEVIAASAMVYGAVCGFFFYYFWARIHFHRNLMDRGG